MNRRLLTMIGAWAVLSAGCDVPQSATTPTTTSTQSPTSASSAPIAADIRRYLDRPCDLLGPDERAAFGLQGEPDRDTSDYGSICSWSGGDIELMIDLRPTKNPLDVSPLEASEGLTWEPRIIEGLSAGVRQQEASRQHCEIAVETGPQQGIYLVYKGLARNVDWCGKAITLGEIMVRRLRAG
ncbi:DUF3558 family protein [Actinokineospora xionganensis]|uniref:DUF3558 domain-containing protein n=1 Tax=Actinokineospora xionganensis TaxID=2684470 RepID=A0ABR7L5V3_9PSEU|nr:DUF3558 family protein [Actinokineospora xionganensis]MBC6448065.1 DUF3558 domain-containing protein [Actinokineospora xionganensis]